MSDSSTPAVAVVTGANRGIGYAVAEHLAHRNVRLVIVARNPGRGRDAQRSLSETAAAPVDLVTVDLADLADVRQAAARLLDLCPQLDILIHNAGVWPTRREQTADGFETAFATNHLAPFLLNRLLEQRLLKSNTKVVQVSAGLYVKGSLDSQRTPWGDDFHPIRTYATTKLCNLAITQRLALRWAETSAGTTINAVHPGVIRTGLGDPGGLLGLALKALKLTWAAPSDGAKPIVRLALDPELDNTNGAYFHIDERTSVAPVARDNDLIDRLWIQAHELTDIGLARPTPHADGSEVPG